MDAVDFETRFVLTLVLEVAFALVVIGRFVKTRRARGLSLAALLATISAESVEYDLRWAPPLEEVEERRDDCPGRPMTIRFVETD
jgi:hypothetical protein